MAVMTKYPFTTRLRLIYTIQNKYKVDAVPHIICGGFTKEDTENALIDLDFLGIENVLALRGDNLKSEYDFKAEIGGHTNALELIHQLKNMNNGIYLDEDLENPTPTSFCIGAAGYPGEQGYKGYGVRP